MEQEILEVKLCQLNDRMEKLHSRIHMSETKDCRWLRKEICSLRQECEEEEAVIRENLQKSRTALTAILAQSCGQIEPVIRQFRIRLQELEAGDQDRETVMEEKILLAEYALDFAHLAADRALLLSMDAMAARTFSQQEGEEK